MGSKIILEFRQKYHMSQRQLAMLLGVTVQAVMLWEKNERVVPVTTRRVISLLDRYPELIVEFDKG